MKPALPARLKPKQLFTLSPSVKLINQLPKRREFFARRLEELDSLYFRELQSLARVQERTHRRRGPKQ